MHPSLRSDLLLYCRLVRGLGRMRKRGKMNTAIERPPTLAQVVVAKLREEIFRGTLRAGQQLAEPELSTRYEVSRGTIREALRQASNDGLLSVLPHRGARVISLTRRVVHETYSLRVLMESYAVEYAWKAQAYDEETLTSLHRLVSRMEEAQRSGDAYEQIRTDFDFHWALCAASQHSLLLTALREPQWITRLCMINAKNLIPDLPGDALRHLPIVEGLEAGCDAAVEALVEHLRVTEKLLLAKISESSETRPMGDQDNTVDLPPQDS